MAKKIYVIGDFGIDHYFYGNVRGISAEAPIPIVDVYGDTSLPGMAGNVASNLKALGASVLDLPQQGPCPIKTRVMTSDGVQIARFDSHDFCSPYTIRDLVSLMDADAVVVADYGKGSISPEVVEMLKSLTIPLFVDTKRDPKVWVGSETAILFPNKEEYIKFEESYNWLPRVVLKLGASGAQWVEFGRTILQRPALSTSPQCVNGAGDTVISAFVVSFLSGLSIPQCLEVSMAAAGVVVEKNFLSRTVSEEEIVERLRTQDARYGIENQTQDPPSGSSLPGISGVRGLLNQEGECGRQSHPLLAPDGDGDSSNPQGSDPSPVGRGIHRVK